MLKTLLCKSLQHTLNRLLHLDAASGMKLEALNGKLFLLRCTRPSLSFYIQIEHQHVQLFDFADTERGDANARQIFNCVPDATLEGSASALLTLIHAAEPAAALSASEASLRGDYQAFRDFLSLLSNLQPDFEAPLAELVGDVAAHSIGKSWRTFSKYGKHAAGRFKDHLQEYLAYELKLGPSANELENWQQQVQQCKERSERLQAQIAQLKNNYHYNISA